MTDDGLFTDEDKVLAAVWAAFVEHDDHVADLAVYETANAIFPMNESLFYLAIGMLAAKRLLVPVDRRQPGVEQLIDYRWRAMSGDLRNRPPTD